MDGMVNRCELSLNVVKDNKPKALTVSRRDHRLEPKGTEASSGTLLFPDADVDLPAKRQHLTHLMVCKWNVVSP
jgi:hypothetical protein